jgi:hypothetical protein
MRFRMKLIIATFHDNCYSLVNSYRNRLLPSIRKFIFIPNRSNEFVNRRQYCFTSCNFNLKGLLSGACGPAVYTYMSVIRWLTEQFLRLVCKQVTILILQEVTSRLAAPLKFIYSSSSSKLSVFLLLLVASSLILSFGYSIFVFLKCLLASHLTLFS